MPKTKKKNDGEIVINLDNFAIPIAIVVAGLLIAVGIFFSNKGKDANPTVEGTLDTTAGEEFTATSTNIDDDPYLGDKGKVKVAVVEFSDFQCSYCKRHSDEVFPLIKSEYIDTGKIIYVFRDYQFFAGLSIDAAMGGQCLYDLTGKDNGKYAEYHQGIFGLTSKDAITTLAKKLGVNESKFQACMDAEKYSEEIAKDQTDGTAAGVKGTPGFVIGVLKDDGTVEGKFVGGAYPIESFRTLIDEMLAK
ncbi:MAG TPA: thioredoxin domain-containing protein [Candidatus Dojkabacteria bacterium]|nr:thioredoxin domain-containing protein [Candidatus Dojkabacteria bacterium]